MSRPTPNPDSLAEQPARRPASDALREDPVVWLSSVQRDGRPHLVPVWFHWDGERIVAFSKPGARKIDNLREDPRVMLAVGTPGADFDVELIEATAELPDAPAADVMPEGFGAKYRELLRRAGLSVQRFAEVYSQPIVLRPTRFLGYGGPGWDAAGSMAT
ncbi:MAG TPA: pyridoxamine 5'-phosphate oxidase family protein [Candidatus Limnocylindria bacterium]|nr:pyridoxamine 5'-phosphate oxidase family protein [Candidatus Limnocylindria bacterium]